MIHTEGRLNSITKIVVYIFTVEGTTISHIWQLHEDPYRHVRTCRVSSCPEWSILDIYITRLRQAIAVLAKTENVDI